jgi:hypothetical protein
LTLRARNDIANGSNQVASMPKLSLPRIGRPVTVSRRQRSVLVRFGVVGQAERDWALAAQLQTAPGPS